MNNDPGNKKKRWKKLLSRGTWRRITSVLMAVVVFLTTYMMILPALTINLDTALEEPGMYVASADTKSEEPVAAGSSSGDIDEILTDNTGEAAGSVQPEFENSAVLVSAGDDSGDLQDDLETAAYNDDAASLEDSLIIPPETGADITADETNYYDETIPELAGSEEESSSEEHGEELIPTDEFGETATENSYATTEEEAEGLPSEETETVEDAAEPAEFFDGEAESTEENDAETAPLHVLKAEGTDYRVTVSCTEEAEIPDNAVLQVTEILSGENDYDTYVNEAANTLSTEDRIMSVENARFFDITILDGDVPVEPKAPVTVVVELADNFAASDDAAVLHYKEDKVTVVDTVDPVEAAENIAAGTEADAVLSAGEVTGREEPGIVPEETYGAISEETAVAGEEIYELTPEEISAANEETYELAPEEIFAADEETYELTPEEAVTISEEAYGMTTEDALIIPEDFETAEVRTAEPAETTETEEKTEEFTLDETMNPIAFVADSFSVYGFVTTTLEKAILASNGHNYTATMTYGADAVIPEGAELHVEEVAEDAEMADGTKYADAAAEALGIEEDKAVKTGLFDIHLTVGEEKIQPKAPVRVTIALDDAKEAEETAVVHFGESGPEVPEQSAEEGNVSFETDGFSVYAVVYTVDFHYEVNGKTYDFSIPGGGFAALSDVLQMILTDVTVSGSEAEENEETQDAGRILVENAESGIDNSAIREILKGVEKVEFSDPGLVWAGKADVETTVGNLKQSNGLEVQYSAELTEEQIEEINAQKVQAGDWALISMLPFDTEETLTVTMSNGDRFAIRVTDAQTMEDVAGRHGVTNTANVGVYSGHNLVFNTQIDTIETAGTRVKLLGMESGSLSMSSWYQVTYLKNGESITGYVETKYIDLLEMIDPVSSENDAFKVTVSYEKGVLPEGTALEAGDPSLTEEERKALENQALTVLPVSTDKTLKVTEIHFFDLSFMADGVEVEPNGEVNVSMQLKQAIPAEENEGLHLVHFTGGEAELLENTVFTRDESANLTGLDFTVGSFSTFAVVKTIETTVITSNGVTYDVTVYYPEDANIPDGSTLSVTEFAEDSEKYAYARRAVLADIKENNEWVNLSDFGFAALDISILNPEGVEIEPETRVFVDLKIKSLPGVENLDEVKDSLAIQHHVETENGVVVETVYGGTDNASFKVETDDVIISNGVVVDPDSVSDEDFTDSGEQYVETDFSTGYFSTYSVTWRANGWSRFATIHYGYMNGNRFVEFPDNQPAYTPEFNDDYAFLIYDIDGYEYDSTHLGSASGTSIQPLLYIKDNNHEYTTGSTNGWGYLIWNDFSNNSNIYVVYKPKEDAVEGGKPQVPENLNWPDQDTPSDTPTFSKSSINNGDDTNTISLSITAPEKQVANFPKANVIVIMDLSGSMTEIMDNNKSRLENAKTAINQMATTLLSKTGTDGAKLVKMALITFGAPVTVAQNFTDNLTTFQRTVNIQNSYGTDTYNGGTNWEGALYEANRLAVDEDAATFVVFVTDGNPTFRVSRGEHTDAELASEQHDRGTYQPFREIGIYGYGGGNTVLEQDVYYDNFNFAVQQVEEIVTQNKYFYTIGISNDVTRLEELCTSAEVPANHAFPTDNADGLTNAFDSVVSSISAVLGFGNISIEDGITALTNLKMKVLQEADEGSIKYYRYGGKNNKYGNGESNKTEWTTREADGCGIAAFNPDTGCMEWDMGESFQLEDDVTYMITFRVWPSQAAYDLIADLNNGTKEWDDLSSDERDQIVETGTDSSTGKKTYALKTNTETLTATYNRTTQVGETVSVADSEDFEAIYKEGTIENMNLKSEKIKLRKEWEHGINESHSANSVNFRLLVDGKYYQEDGGADTEESSAQIIPVSDSTNPKWENSIFIATGIMDYDETTGEMDILEAGHDYVLDEYQLYENGSLSIYAESYEFESQTVHPMRINGTLTYLILYENDSEVPVGSKTYVLNGKKYYTAADSTGILSGTNYRKAELDITKLIENHSALTETDLDKETFTYRVTLEVPKDADVSLITAYEFVKRADGTLNYIDGYKAGDGPINGDETRFSEKSYRWYTVSYGTGKTIGEGFVLSEDGKCKTITMDITLNRNEVLRFTNLPTGTNYTIEEYYANYRQADPSKDADAVGSSAESNLENQGYSVEKIISKSTGGDETSITGVNCVEGSISEPNKRYYNQFTNKLEDVADAELSVTKHLENYSWSGERYYFKLTPEQEGNPMPVRNSLYISAASGTDDKTYSFGQMRYTQAGNYTYTIQETDKNGIPLSGTASDDGIVYGEGQTVTITVEPVNGKLAVTKITNAQGEVISSNTAGSALVTGSVTVTNALNELPIKKLDSESKSVIHGAVFELYLNNIEKQYLEDNSRVLTQTQVETIIGMSINADGAVQKMKEAEISSDFTIGETVLRGLPLNRTYVLREKMAPDGYIITSNDFEFSLRRDSETGKMFTSLKGNQTNISLDEDGITIMIDNAPGAALPNTGGPGTNLIYLFGIILTGLAGTGLVLKRRRRSVA